MKRTRRQAVAECSSPSWAACDDVGMIGEAEVVVRAEVDDLAAVDRDAGALRRLDLPLALVEALALRSSSWVRRCSRSFGVAHGGARVGHLDSDRGIDAGPIIVFRSRRHRAQATRPGDDRQTAQRR